MEGGYIPDRLQVHHFSPRNRNYIDRRVPVVRIYNPNQQVGSPAPPVRESARDKQARKRSERRQLHQRILSLAREPTAQAKHHRKRAALWRIARQIPSKVRKIAPYLAPAFGRPPHTASTRFLPRTARKTGRASTKRRCYWKRTARGGRRRICPPRRRAKGRGRRRTARS